MDKHNIFELSAASVAKTGNAVGVSKSEDTHWCVAIAGNMPDGKKDVIVSFGYLSAIRLLIPTCCLRTKRAGQVLQERMRVETPSMFYIRENQSCNTQQYKIKQRL